MTFARRDEAHASASAALPIRRDPHDPLAHLDLIADIADEVGDDAGEGGGQRVLHLHRFDDGEALARLDPLALLDMERGDPPVHRRADAAVALVGAARSPIERIDQLDEGLPAAGEGVNAVRSLEQRDLGLVGRGRRAPAQRSSSARSPPPTTCRRSGRPSIMTSRPSRRAPMSSNESATPQGSNG